MSPEEIDAVNNMRSLAGSISGKKNTGGSGFSLKFDGHKVYKNYSLFNISKLMMVNFYLFLILILLIWIAEKKCRDSKRTKRRRNVGIV